MSDPRDAKQRREHAMAMLLASVGGASECVMDVTQRLINLTRKLSELGLIGDDVRVGGEPLLLFFVGYFRGLEMGLSVDDAESAGILLAVATRTADIHVEERKLSEALKHAEKARMTSVMTELRDALAQLKGQREAAELIDGTLRRGAL